MIYDSVMARLEEYSNTPQPPYIPQNNLIRFIDAITESYSTKFKTGGKTKWKI